MKEPGGAQPAARWGGVRGRCRSPPVPGAEPGLGSRGSLTPNRRALGDWLHGETPQGQDMARLSFPACLGQGAGLKWATPTSCRRCVMMPFLADIKSF